MKREEILNVSNHNKEPSSLSKKNLSAAYDDFRALVVFRKIWFSPLPLQKAVFATSQPNSSSHFCLSSSSSQLPSATVVESGFWWGGGGRRGSGITVMAAWKDQSGREREKGSVEVHEWVWFLGVNIVLEYVEAITSDQKKNPQIICNMFLDKMQQKINKSFPAGVREIWNV